MCGEFILIRQQKNTQSNLIEISSNVAALDIITIIVDAVVVVVVVERA